MPGATGTPSGRRPACTASAEVFQERVAAEGLGRVVDRHADRVGDQATVFEPLRGVPLPTLGRQPPRVKNFEIMVGEPPGTMWAGQHRE
ncbi:MAG: hypothetical protein FJ284_11845 [Planctomycetes bacterium]|nr:hypothetical protein [Planctomycetota bacterium]